MSTVVCRPIKQVFDFVSAPENDSNWQYGTLLAARLPDGDSNSFFRSIGHLLGRRNQGTFEVTEYEPHRKYSFKSLSGPLHLQTSYIFEESKGSTKISITTDAHGSNFFEMNERLLEKTMKKQLKENLALLKDLLEATPALPVSEAVSQLTRESPEPVDDALRIYYGAADVNHSTAHGLHTDDAPLVK
jgi:hypothetical protein